jgi:hypothetical protein
MQPGIEEATMHETFDFDACLCRIRAGWIVGRTCRLAARGMQMRVRRARREYLAGRISLDRAVSLASEAEQVSFSFGPIGEDAGRAGR